MNRTIDGIWEGVTTSAVQLDIKEVDGNCTNRNLNLRNWLINHYVLFNTFIRLKIVHLYKQ